MLSDQVITDETQHFTRQRPVLLDENDFRTIQAWVVDVPDLRYISSLLSWLKQTSLDTPDLGHLKRVRKQNDQATFLLCASAGAVQPPSLPPNIPAPYIVAVPASSALTPASLALKSNIWPTMYTPRRKEEPEPWTRGKLSWAREAINRTVDAAIAAAESHQLPIAAHIPPPYDPLLQSSSHNNLTSFSASDTRMATKHPLKHSILNLIHQVADFQSSNKTPTNYLLTDQTVFVTHEPCIMCSMALLHSRVKEVIYLFPMPKTGGCGGCANLPALKGVNHRFSILHWHSFAELRQKDSEMELCDTVDV